jgi:hypothetical protein
MQPGKKLKQCTGKCLIISHLHPKAGTYTENGILQYSISRKWLHPPKAITATWKDSNFNWHSTPTRMYPDSPKSHIITCDPLFLHYRVVSLERVDLLFVGFTFHCKLQATRINPSHLLVLFLDRALNGVQYSPHPFHTQFL